VPGTYCLSETTKPTGYNADPLVAFPTCDSFSVAAGQTVSKSYTDPPLPGSIQITKTDDVSPTGNAVAGATFTAFSCSTAGCESTSNVAGSCTTSGSPATCTISSLAPGTYTIDEVTNTLASGVPTGYYGDPSLPKTVTVTRNTATTLNLVDPRKFKVIVIVCRQVDSKLYPSAVTVDGTARGNSLAAADIPAALSSSSGSVESQLCGISAGSASGLKAAPDASNPHSGSVSIPNHQ
jgi:uncharacterized surface anchored protein